IHVTSGMWWQRNAYHCAAKWPPQGWRWPIKGTGKGPGSLGEPHMTNQNPQRPGQQQQGQQKPGQQQQQTQKPGQQQGGGQNKPAEQNQGGTARHGRPGFIRKGPRRSAGLFFLPISFPVGPNSLFLRSFFSANTIDLTERLRA